MRQHQSIVIALVLLGVSCGGDPAAPSPTAWASGSWHAVLVNGAPLPANGAALGNSSAYPFTRYDSLNIYIFEPPLSGLAASVFPYQTLIFSASSSSPILCWDSDVLVAITATGLTTLARGATTAGGHCSPLWVSYALTRLGGDTLAGLWDGQSVKLVRRP